MKECFAENRRMWCSSGNCLVKGHMMFGKSISITQQAVGDTLALVRLAFFVDLCLS